jgi:hypothetical protein
MPPPRRRSIASSSIVGVVLLTGVALERPAMAQHTPIEAAGDPAVKPPHRTRLILKDGSYQVVMSYTVFGDRVRLVSAERSNDVEEIPLDLVDMAATKRWETDHAPADPNAPPRPAPAIDPELVKAEADRAALSPEVAPDLHLAPEDNLLALDTFQATPELVPLTQSSSDLNQQTGHSILKGIVNPRSAAHQIVQLKGEKAAVQLHVNDPELYIRIDDAMPLSGTVLTVDTHGASTASGKDRTIQANDFVIVRVDVRQDARVVASFSTDKLGAQQRQEDVIETTTTVLPGGHWAKIVPRQPLLVGEYCLVEVLGPNQLNLGVWDFGIHPTAPENRDVLKPEKKRPIRLEKRQQP